MSYGNIPRSVNAAHWQSITFPATPMAGAGSFAAFTSSDTDEDGWMDARVFRHLMASAKAAGAGCAFRAEARAGWGEETPITVELALSGDTLLTAGVSLLFDDVLRATQIRFLHKGVAGEGNTATLSLCFKS